MIRFFMISFKKYIYKYHFCQVSLFMGLKQPVFTNVFYREIITMETQTGG